MDKRTKIIGIVALVAIVVLLLVMFTSKKGGSTVNMNETLDIKVSNLDYDFSVKVNSVETNQEIEDETYVKINLTMTRNSGDVPNPILVSYTLLDSKDNELASSNSALSIASLLWSDIEVDTLFNEENLETSKITSGDIYFNTSSNNIKKVRVDVATKGLNSTESDMEYYYINLD